MSASNRVQGRKLENVIVVTARRDPHYIFPAQSVRTSNASAKWRRATAGQRLQRQRDNIQPNFMHGGESMNKKRIPVNRPTHLLLTFLAILAFSAMSVSVWANKTDPGNAVSGTIRLTAVTKVGNTQLAAGEYKFIADENEAKFQKGNKVVAQIPCTLKPLSFMPKATVYVTENGGISEIQVSGSEMAIEFSTGRSSGN